MAQEPFDPVPSQISFVDQEQSMLALWEERDVFRRSVEERPEDQVFSFYEGPPTANGNPGIHHVLARAFKDLIPRYRTMRGYRVPRKGGWDTHGLPVELEVERDLGLASKLEIEAYGVDAFNQKCKESVFGYVSEWERMTDRIGFWIDMDDAYVTYSSEYIETCWWIFKRLWEHDLVFRDYRVTPHCPRCETSLSSHEIAQGYQDDTPDPSITIRFPLIPNANQNESLRLGDGIPTSLLAWTTTPWTLPGNTALAIAPTSEYVLVELPTPDGGRERVILADDRYASVLKTNGVVIDRLQGSKLVGMRYEPLYSAEKWDGVEQLAFIDGRAQPVQKNDDESSRLVISSPHVTTEDGTGVLHVAPAFGADDYEMGRSEGLLFLQPVTLSGTAIGGPGDGMFVKDADTAVIDDLQERGLLWESTTTHHTYPFCWRCDTPVLYYAKPSWYIRTTDVRQPLVEHNREITWVPDHIRDGRFGEWLEGNVDWSISRERYWGTPLPLWVCELCGHTDCIGSYSELRDRARGNTMGPDGEFEPHRPYIDHVELSCPQCNGTMRRTVEVADAWFDSGAMPYAQWHYPFENRELFNERFPADFICEAVDQTRGWFYTLHALSTLLNHTQDLPEGIAFRNVICLGLVLDADGQKMSKTRGNVVDPWEVLDTHGADAVRWYMYTSAPPGNERRFSDDLVRESSRRFISTLWNTYSFFVTYANIARFEPALEPSSEGRTELDRWVLSELHRTVHLVTEALDSYEPSEAARPIGEFVEQLSNWYVRRSRRRFWKSDDSSDTQAALYTLHECLATVTRLIAPFTPFLAEAMYQNLVAGKLPNMPDSVHLDAWPTASQEAIDEQLSSDLALVQRMVSLGHRARSEAHIKVRQPLDTALLIPRHGREQAALERFADTIADELNVKQVLVTADPPVHYRLRPNLAVLGPRLGRDVRRIQLALEKVDAEPLVRHLRAGDQVELEGFQLSATDIIVEQEAPEGWSVGETAGYTTMIRSTLTPELEAEGLARDMVRAIQSSRRTSGYEVTDRIDTEYYGGPTVQSAVNEHAEYIRAETLSKTLTLMSRQRAQELTEELPAEDDGPTTPIEGFDHIDADPSTTDFVFNTSLAKPQT